MRSARLYVAGLGHAVAWINGERVDDAELNPPCTDYDLRILYTTHDVTSLLQRGGNAIGIALGRGFFATKAVDSDGTHLSPWVAEPQVKAQLEVTLADGRRVSVGTDPDWQVTEGPTVYDSLYTGETYDANRTEQLADWTMPGFDAEDWRPAATVRMLYAEKLGPSGRIEVGVPGGNHNPSVVGRFQVDEFIAAGTGDESWQPSFTYKGFRYVEVSGTDRPLQVHAVPVQSDVSHISELQVEHPVLQWIVDACRQTTRNALHGLPDPSPMHSKLGWTGNAHFASQPMLYLYGMAGLFDKWLDDIRLSQAPDGNLPTVTPVGRNWPAGLSPTWTGVGLSERHAQRRRPRRSEPTHRTVP